MMPELNQIVLAEGTATGHKHQIVDGESRLFMVQKFDHKHMTLNVISEYATLQHEEHQSIQIPQ